MIDQVPVIERTSAPRVNGSDVARSDEPRSRGPSPDDLDDTGDAHEQPEELVFIHDRASGLRAGISLHSTVLGPAIGGCRFFPYLSLDDAIEDVTRLGRAMTAKASLAGLDFGGGKSVIIGDPAVDKTDERLRAFGHLVDRLGGRYITAEDVGTTTADMDLIGTVTPHVLGRSVASGGAGDPSGATATGVLEAMVASANYLWGTGAPSDDREVLRGRHVVVLGVGKVGSRLVRLLVDAGARVTVADVNHAAVEDLRSSLGVGVAAPAEAHLLECDVLAPCAMGGLLDSSTIGGLRCRAVVGSANNQLGEPEDAGRLADAGILYVPDYLVNAGGLIHVADDLAGFDEERVASRVRAIGTTTDLLLREAEREGITPVTAADRMARRRILRKLAAADEVAAPAA